MAVDLTQQHGWVKLDEFRGYATNKNDAEAAFKAFEVSRSTTFVSEKTVAEFGRNDSKTVMTVTYHTTTPTGNTHSHRTY